MNGSHGSDRRKHEKDLAVGFQLQLRHLRGLMHLKGDSGPTFDSVFMNKEPPGQRWNEMSSERTAGRV